jgi:glycosyltransferase involved in cell wall biosynthesis
MPELSIIVPYVNEYPQILFTLQSIAQDLRGRADFEVIAVNNYCDEVIQQDRDTTRRIVRRLKAFYDLDQPEEEIIEAMEGDEIGLIGPEDKGGKAVKACAKGNDWLTAIEYRDKLSHWNAKRVGVQHSDSKFIQFIDAHCIIGRNALHSQYNYYRESYDRLDGTLHLPLTYLILEWRRLIYSLRFVHDENTAQLDYKFSSYKNPSNGLPYEVPCMSTCGMMMTRELYEEVGGWPEELGIYSGGEHFMNFTLAVLGKKKWIFPTDYALYHHAERRGYAFNSGDTLRNRLIAAYLYGGRDWLEENAMKAKGRPKVINRYKTDIPELCRDQRQWIKDRQEMTIFQWLEKWGKI